jgi:hypothetical protein
MIHRQKIHASPMMTRSLYPPHLLASPATQSFRLNSRTDNRVTKGTLPGQYLYASLCTTVHNTAFMNVAENANFSSNTETVIYQNFNSPTMDVNRSSESARPARSHEKTLRPKERKQNHSRLRQ